MPHVIDNTLRAMRYAADYEELAARVRHIPGWITGLEGFALWQLAAHGPGVGQIVEVGSYAGLSTACLALGTAHSAREGVVAVDRFVDTPDVHPQLPESARLAGGLRPYMEAGLEKAGIRQHVRILQGDSPEIGRRWSGGSVRLLFLDGDHSAQGIANDFAAWSPHLAPRGLLVFHDVGNPRAPDVEAFYRSTVLGSGKWRELLGVVSLRVVERVG
jgi:predicted O-methyltransferase YrrM